MTKEQREDLVMTNGHSMTWKRYHRYGGKYVSIQYSSIYSTMYERVVLLKIVPDVLN